MKKNQKIEIEGYCDAYVTQMDVNSLTYEYKVLIVDRYDISPFRIYVTQYESLVCGDHDEMLKGKIQKYLKDRGGKACVAKIEKCSRPNFSVVALRYEIYHTIDLGPY